MASLESGDIGKAGEMIVENWLRTHNWRNIIRNTQQPGGTDIQADGGTSGNILVQVKTALTPNQPSEISELEKSAITSRATRLNRIAYSAYVVIDSNKNLIGEIRWRKLG